MERTNKIYIVGTLLDLPADKLRRGSKDGNDWISGLAIVKSGDSEIEVKFFSLANTKDNKPNKRYANYLTLENLVGKRVKINGDLSGRVFYNEGQGQITAFNEINAGFFNIAGPEDKDTATFEYSGFVTKPLHDRLNKDEKVVAHEIEIAQANYNQDNMQIFRFMVRPDDTKIRQAVEASYEKNTTVFITGVIEYEVSFETKTEEVDFGDPTEKVYRNVLKKFIITGGKQPITQEGLAYTVEDIRKLESSYQEYLTFVEEQAKSSATAVKSEPAKTNNTDRLL